MEGAVFEEDLTSDDALVRESQRLSIRLAFLETVARLWRLMAVCPEMLDGRVKTLTPQVHAGILFVRDNEEHIATMNEYELGQIDLVCVRVKRFDVFVGHSTSFSLVDY